MIASGIIKNFNSTSNQLRLNETFHAQVYLKNVKR